MMSVQLLSSQRPQPAIVIGRVLSESKLTQNNRGRFWLKAEALTFTKKTAKHDKTHSQREIICHGSRRRW